MNANGKQGKISLITLATIMCCADSWNAAAETVTLTPIQDTTLYQDPAGAIANGAGEHFFVGRTPMNLLRRGLLEFDLTVLPANATITSATLRLNMSRTGTGPTPVSLHRVLADWGEGASDADGDEGAGAPAVPPDATWLYRRFDTQTWSTPGGDFDATISATITVDVIGVYVWPSGPQLVADVQSWLAAPASNFGWCLVADEQVASAKRFDTRESLDPTVRPQLTIEFTTPPACLGDVDSDGIVGLSDLAILLSNFGTPSGATSGQGDLDGDGDVDLQDLAALLGNFGVVCPP